MFLCKFFKNIFRRCFKMRSRKESFIGLASESDLRIALHYQDAFEVLYNSNKDQDHIVIPALFLVRQFLELGLKYNIRILSTVSGSTELLNDLSKTHNLEKLHWAFLDHYIKAKLNLNIKPIKDNDLLRDLKQLVNIINPLDNNSVGYRYTNDKNGNKLIGLDETYNLENVHKILENVSLLLSATEDVFGLTNKGRNSASYRQFPCKMRLFFSKLLYEKKSVRLRVE